MAAELRWAEKYPELGLDPVPIESCVSEEIYEQEVDKIFRKVWLKVARDEELPKPGDWKVKRLHFAKTSVILIRGKDGVVRGFHNICSHRGNTVITETGDETFGSSKAAVLPCRFHGWVYDAKGQIVQIRRRSASRLASRNRRTGWRRFPRRCGRGSSSSI